MRIAVFVKNPQGVYSGGRYHALVLALSLGHMGNEVYYISNNRPIFYDDFKTRTHAVIPVDTSDFKENLPEGPFDIVVLVPHPSKPKDTFFSRVRSFARERRAKLALLNFESGNWFNEYAAAPVDLDRWRDWRAACKDGCLVLSSAKESNKYAEQFYVDYPKNTYFDYWYPSINSYCADSIPDQTRENRIVAMARPRDKHKGAQDLLGILCKEFKGYTLTLMLGTSDVSEENQELLEEIKLNAKRFEMKVEFLFQLSDYEKFKLIKKSRLMIYTSYFEGFGYPPVESQYCNTPCVAYDLPVLREVSRNGIYYSPRGKIMALRNLAVRILQDHPNRPQDQNLRENIYSLCNFEKNAPRLEAILQNYLALEQDDKPSIKATQKALPAQNINKNTLLPMAFKSLPILFTLVGITLLRFCRRIIHNNNKG